MAEGPQLVNHQELINFNVLQKKGLAHPVKAVPRVHYQGAESRNLCFTTFREAEGDISECGELESPQGIDIAIRFACDVMSPLRSCVVVPLLQCCHTV